MKSFSFREVFGNKKVFLAVVHVTDYFQALRNVDLAARYGADGAFLISHRKVPDPELIEIYQTIREERGSHGLPYFWAGLNCLNMRETEVFSKVPPNTDGIWLDDLGLRRRDPEQRRAKAIRAARHRSKWEGLLFGGVAFKYQERVPYSDIAELARLAREFCDVVTTSGEATGKAPEMKKIQLMRDALGDFPLAIASGMTPQNVKNYLHAADCFLVATGVAKLTELDPKKVEAFAEAIK
jgi:hypothetical protein